MRKRIIDCLSLTRQLLLGALIMTTMTTQAEAQTIIGKHDITIEGGQLTPEALWAMGRISNYDLSPDGKRVVYQVGYYSIEENKGHQQLYVMNIDGTAKQLLTTTADSETDPTWINGGKSIAYLSKGQLWTMLADGTNRQQLTSDAIDIEGYLFSPDEKKIILLKSIPFYGSIANKPADLQKTTGRLVTALNYRHWDHYVESIVHPFLADIVAGKADAGKDLLEGEPYECPVAPFGGIEQFSWSPDGTKIAYSSKKSQGLNYAISTDSDIYLYDLATGTTTNLCKPANYVEPAIDATKSLKNQPINQFAEDYNVGYDTNPKFSPDGKQIAWLSMERCGYEADKNRLCVYTFATQSKEYLTDKFDSDVNDYHWADTKTERFFFISTWHARSNIYSISKKGEIKSLTNDTADYGSMKLLADGKKIIAERHNHFAPADLYLISLDKKGVETRRLTQENEHILSQLNMGQTIERWVKTTSGEDMQYWVILPPNFDANKKYPTLLYCQGGPQSAVSQFWSYRWNFALMAAQGYIVVAPNRHGLPGFGQKWNEQISGDWTGQCMQDYLTAIDDATTLPYVDKNRLGAVGASFGGFSVFYLAGHHEGRFKAFIAHAGAFNLESMYSDTEEAFFSNWEYDDAFWNKDLSLNAKRTYDNSPHRFVDKWDTPILVIQGEKDYRIPLTQGIGAFNAAQLRGIPSELLIFPDENHWILRPQNAILWQRTFFSWLDRWLKD